LGAFLQKTKLGTSEGDSGQYYFSY